MINVKRLVVNFLVITALASLVVLVFSSWPNIFPSSKKVITDSPLIGRSTPIPKNAFVADVETMPIALRGNLSGARSNLTTATAKDLSDLIIAINPTGGQNIGGETGLVVPTTTILAGYLAMQNVGAFKVSDLWVSPSDQPVIMAPSSDTAANLAYTQAFRDIMKNTLSNQKFLTAFAQSASANSPDGTISTVIPTFSEALVQLKKLPVPAPFVEFQKSFLTYIEDQRNITAALALSDVDPLKSLIVIGNGDDITKHIVNDFSMMADEYRKLDLNSLLALSEPDENLFDGLAASFRKILDSFTLHQAKALSLAGTTPEDQCGKDFSDMFTNFFGNLADLFTKVPVVDKPVENNTSGILAVLLFDCQDRIMTQQAKASEVNIMNGAITANAQRDGDPSFIRDYEAYMGNAAVEGATRAHQESVPNTCPQFQKDVNAIIFDPKNALSGLVGTPRGSLLTSNSVTNLRNVFGGIGLGFIENFGSSGITGTGGGGCSLAILRNPSGLSGFYNDFNSNPNAWSDYVSILVDPTNNIYGTLANTQQNISAAAQGAESAAETESIANQGNRSDVECGSGAYTDSNGNIICPNEKIVTPGNVIATALQTAVGAQYQTILNAQNMSELETELANSLTSQLLNNVDVGLFDLSFTTDNSLAGVCNNLSIPGIQTNPAFSACNSMIGKVTSYFTKYIGIIRNISSFLRIFF